MWTLFSMDMIIPMQEGMCLSAQVKMILLNWVQSMTSNGPKQYGLDRKQILAYKSQGYRSDKTAEQTQFFQVISIEDNTLSYVAYTVMGDEYDRATITKDFATGKKSLKD